MTAPQEHQIDVARGDVGVSRHLKDSLRLLARRNPDPEFRRIVDDVLAGRKGLRDVYTDPAYTRAMNSQVESFAQRWEALSDEEKEELARVGQAQLDELAAAPPRPEDLPPGPEGSAGDDDEPDDGPLLEPAWKV